VSGARHGGGAACDVVGVWLRGRGRLCGGGGSDRGEDGGEREGEGLGERGG